MLPKKTINGITFNIRHTMLLVSDMERTVDFYTRLLGMDVQRIRDVPERQERVRYLGYGDENAGPSLELVESAETRGKPSLAPWTGHVALSVSDCYKLSEKLKAEGVEFISGPGPNRRAGKISMLSSKIPMATSSSSRNVTSRLRKGSSYSRIPYAAFGSRWFNCTVRGL